jgi:isopentenyl phosphate kinase
MILLKLGGSLITVKSQPETARSEVIGRIAGEIAQAIQERPALRLIVGHGSGSFGHPMAARFSTHLGALTAADWLGFTKVWAAAQRLNRMVIDGLLEVGLPAISFPPSVLAVCDEHKIVQMAIEPIHRALEAGLLPVVYGDVAFDRTHGSTILSTEMVFLHLAASLRPERVLLAGIEPGVYSNYPESPEILPLVTERQLPQLSLSGAADTDVTGGMKAKVEAALALAQTFPQTEVRIFSGEATGIIKSALLGGSPGTLIAPG